MKFFVFTCLLAVALAKQRMEQYSSSEESMDISQENFKKDVDVVVFPRQETVKNIHIPQMESAEAPMKNKCYQTIQKFQTPQALKALYQHHVARNPWGNTVNCAFPSTRTLESDIISQQQYNQNMMDMSMKAIENMMAEEEKNMQDYMNKMKQYSKITWPQFVKLLRQYQKTMHRRSYYPYTPSMV